MSRVSTSAGDSPSAPVSIATLCRTASGVSVWPPADDRDQFGDRPLGQRDVGGLAGQGDGVAADVDVGRQAAFERAQILVGGTEQAHDEVGRNIDAAVHRVACESAFVSRGVTWGFRACFLGSRRCFVAA